MQNGDSRAAAGTATDSAEPAAAIRLVKLSGSFEAFGLVIDYLSRQEPFASYDLGNFAAAIRDQLGTGHHVAALEGPRMAGYCGWLITDRVTAEAWANGSGVLAGVPTGDAAALTVVAAANRPALTMMIRHMRNSSPGTRVYFKRGYADAARPPRKNRVTNR